MNQTRESWMSDALCAQTDPDAFFPEPNVRARAAKRVCAACPVRQQCLDYAIRTGTVDGIWGGLAYPQRRRIAKETA